MHVQNLMNSLWDIRFFLGLVPKVSPCIKVRSSIFWDVTQLISSFGTTYRSHLQGSRSLTLGPVGCPEMPVTTSQRCVTSQKSEDLALRRSRSLKSHILWSVYRLTPKQIGTECKFFLKKKLRGKAAREVWSKYLGYWRIKWRFP